MKLWTVSYTDLLGGAFRAAFRTHHAILAAGIESVMYVEWSSSGDPTVIEPTGYISKGVTFLRPHLVARPLRLNRNDDSRIYSLSILSSSWPERINESEADIVHLHWICREMMSIKDIGRIEKPVVWTLHDMWAFCGAEHYASDERFREGYTGAKRPRCESGFDFNRWTWNRKRRAWRRPMHIVTPSRWLADCVRQSVLMRDWPVSVIHNPIDIEIWSPVGKSNARHLLGMPNDCHLLAFGAVRGGKDPRKGFDLLLKTLEELRGKIPDLQLVVFGERRPRELPDVGLPIHYTGHLHDELSLRVLYSAVDAMIIPSRQENLPNTGVEALACGTPVIAFNTCGLPDIVRHQETGWLAEAFDTEDLARGIQWVLEDEERLARLGTNARRYAEQKFAAPVIADQYRMLYENVLESVKVD